MFFHWILIVLFSILNWITGTTHSAKLRLQDTMRTSQKDVLWTSKTWQRPENFLYQRLQDVEIWRQEDVPM